MNNIYKDIPGNLSEEVTEILLKTNIIRIERIISNGQSSPDQFWYDQEENEWIIVLKGKAELLFETGNEIVNLVEGDYLNIPSHKKHRVQWTIPGTETIWLAIFY